MWTSLDLATLRLCSMLASVTFIVIFLSLWRGRRDQAHYAHWAASLLLYCMALAGLEWINRPDDLFMRSLLLAILTASNIPVVTGVRHFAGQARWRWWMAIPPAVTLLGFLLPNILAALGMAMPARTNIILATLGLMLGMGMFGIDMIRQARRAVPHGHGGPIAGFAMLAYIPCYLFSIAGEVLQVATPSTLAIAALLSDQLLLMQLNLGLLAMPAEAAVAALRKSAWRDGLTGAYNRAWLTTREKLYLRRDTWLAQIDVDHFKAINDRLGHAAGDAALVNLAQTLTAAAQDSALQTPGEVVRMGGDEFLVIMPDATRLTAQRMVQDVRTAIGALNPYGWTVSVGLAEVEAEDRSLRQAMERADRNLYVAKLAGRNRVAA